MYIIYIFIFLSFRTKSILRAESKGLDWRVEERRLHILHFWGLSAVWCLCLQIHEDDVSCRSGMAYLFAAGARL